jgi:hypothetical protein
VKHPLTDCERVEALREIVRETERLRDLAKAASGGYLAYLMEMPLHEARSILLAEGHELEAPRPASEEQSDSSVVLLRKPEKPHKPR